MVWLAACWMVGSIVIAAFAWAILTPNACPKYPIANGTVAEECAWQEQLKCGQYDMAWGFTPDWRILTFVAALPALSGGIGFIFAGESPRWLLMKGRMNKAVRQLRRMAKSNSVATYLEHEWDSLQLVNSKAVAVVGHGVMETSFDDGDSDGSEPEGTDYKDQVLPGSTYIAVENTVGESSTDGDASVDSKPVSLSSSSVGSVRKENTFWARSVAPVGEAFKHVYYNTLILFQPPLRRNMVVLCVVWISLCFSFYGLSLWLPNFYKHGGVDDSVNIYFVSFLTALANLPGNVLSAYTVEWIGRAKTLALSMLVSAVAVFCIPAVKTTTATIVFSCVFNGVSVGGWNALNILSTELFPTRQRGSAFGLQTALGRIAAIIGITLFGLLSGGNAVAPLLMTAAAMLFGGFVTFLLPNATGKNMD